MDRIRATSASAAPGDSDPDMDEALRRVRADRPGVTA